MRFLIRDRDAKFSGPFDEVFRTEDVRVIRTPVQAPRANAVAERWVETVRAECLDLTLIASRRHLARVLEDYIEHYNEERPHRALELAAPAGQLTSPQSPRLEEVRRRDVLSGLIHEYYVDAA